MSKINVRSPYFIYIINMVGKHCKCYLNYEYIREILVQVYQGAQYSTNIYCYKWTLLLLKYLNCKRLHLKTLLMEITQIR